MNLPNGHVLQNGKYRLTHVVGQGGFGITYKGIWYTEVKGALGTVRTDVPICVKEYFFKDYCYRDKDSFTVQVHSETGRALFDKFKEKLIKEAKILSEVHHPHIVNVLEVFEENGTAYIAMEYISGNSLKSQMDKEGVLPEAVVLRYISQVGEALQFVHEKNILHLDIKPSNILIDQYGKARLIDFGVSKRYDIEQQETSTTMLTLSKGFASIEQYDDEGTLNFSPCPDIYSLGATMYNLLTGKIPVESILRATRPLKNPTEYNPAISPETEAVILKAMEIVPADRFQTVSEMIAVLKVSYSKLEEVGKELSATNNKNVEEDDTIQLHLSGQPAGTVDDEDDRTIVNVKEPVPVTKKKKKKGLMISVLIAIFACAGSAVAFLFLGSKPVSGKTEITKAASEELHVIPDSPVENVVEVENDSLKRGMVLQQRDTSLLAGISNPVQPKISPEERKEKEVVVSDVTNKGTVLKNTEATGNKTEVKKPVQKDIVADIDEKQSVSLTPEKKDSVYSELIESGKAKMTASDYANAKKDFIKAQETKLTEEVMRLLITCETKEEEKRIPERLAQYELKMMFGKYRVVRKKSTGKYGAIDTKGEERIPCIYLNVGNAENGRSFEREDGLFDIYNAEGVVVGRGLTYY